MPTDLKPCPNPRCTTQSVERESEIVEGYTGAVQFFIVECGECSLRTPCALSQQKADEFWNALPRDPTDEMNGVKITRVNFHNRLGPIDEIAADHAEFHLERLHDNALWFKVGQHAFNVSANDTGELILFEQGKD